MRKKQNKTATSKDGQDVSSQLRVWHPSVHARFREQLYYFLISVRPLEMDLFKKNASVLMKRFEVSDYCVYQIFGNFDVLLRLWLPPGSAQAFLEYAPDTIPNLRSIHHFQNLTKHACSRFAEDFEGDKPPKNALDSLEAEEVFRIQSKDSWACNADGPTQELVKKLQAENLLLVENIPSLEIRRSQIKAFIAISDPPPGIPTKVRVDDILGKIKKRLESTASLEDNFSGVSLMEGTGFCWLLAKVVMRKYSVLSSFINWLMQEYSRYGISTSTFLVSDAAAAMEGDSISGIALRQFSVSNPKVATFFPMLYEPGASQADSGIKRKIEEFVLELIARRLEYYPEDVSALQEYLTAVLQTDAEKAFVALFPRFLNAERSLRDAVLEVSKSLRLQKDLREHLSKCDPKADVSLERLNLLQSLRGANFLIKTCLRTDDALKVYLDESGDELLKAISNSRNLLMHSKPFDLDKDWRDLGDNARILFMLRRKTEMLLRSILDNSIRAVAEQTENLPPRV